MSGGPEFPVLGRSPAPLPAATRRTGSLALALTGGVVAAEVVHAGLLCVGELLRALADRQPLDALLATILAVAAGGLVLALAFVLSREARGFGRVAALVAVAWLAAGWVRKVVEAAALSTPDRVLPGARSMTMEETFALRPRVTYRVNALGFRGVDWPPSAGVRVVFLGDSMVFGVGLREEATLPARLASALGEPAIEVLNLGFPGANVRTYADVLEVLDPQLGATLVVVGITGNDFEGWNPAEERATTARFTPFSAARFLLGAPAAKVLRAALGGRAGAREPGLEELHRLVALATRGGRPLLVFGYHPLDRERLGVLDGGPDVRVAVPERYRPELEFPGDSHLNEEGTRTYAAWLAAVLTAWPEGRAALGR